MLYTRGGDKGSIKTFGCDQSISKSSIIAEALGALDEANSFLGLVRARITFVKVEPSLCEGSTFTNVEINFSDIILEVQQNLFIAQAEVAGATLSISAEKINRVEKIVDEIEKILPTIQSFFISGATEIGSMFDFARTLARRAERRVVAAKEEGKIKVSSETSTYLNRLSSLLYALARISGHIDGVKEIKPSYK